MKKKLLIAAVAGGAAVACAVACKKCGGPSDLAQGKFDNLAAPRTNTDEIPEPVQPETAPQAEHAIP